MLTGENGLIKKAIQAKEESEKASIIENIKLEIEAKKVENSGNINDQEIYEILSKYGTISEDGTMLITKEKKYEISISSIFSNNEYGVEKETIDLKLGNILSSTNTTRNPDNPGASSNTAYSYYLDENSMIEFDDSKYKIIICVYNSNKTNIGSSRWITSSPNTINQNKLDIYSGYSIEDVSYYAIELRKIDDSDIDINTVSCSIVRNYKEFDLVDTSELPLKILLNAGSNFKAIVADNKVISDIDIYASPDGNGNGLSSQNPTNLFNAVSLAKQYNGSTIHLKSGKYYVSSTISWFELSANLICEDGFATIIGTTINDVDFTEVKEKDNLYSISTSEDINKIFEKVDENYNIYSLAETLDKCNSNTGSYFIDNDILYINPLDNINNIIITTKMNGPVIFASIGSSSKDSNIYMKNIEILGGKSCLKVNSNGLGIFENCKFIGSYGYGNNCLSITGNYKSICIKCVAQFSGSDGFNYHGNSRFVEIDCVSGCHGYDEDSRTNSNASTSHETVKGLRMNGVYYDTNGPVVADVGNAMTINIKCTASESKTNMGGFFIETGEMYCFGCSSKFTTRGAVATGGGKLYTKDCSFENESGTTPL